MIARWVGCLFIAALLGCDIPSNLGPKDCDRDEADNPVITYSAGTAADGLYMSSPWEGPLVYFPGGSRFRFEHHLGTTPRAWQAYLSFDEAGVESGSLAPAAGNQVELIGIDGEAVTVKNGSCSDYYLLLTAQSTDAPDT